VKSAGYGAPPYVIFLFLTLLLCLSRKSKMCVLEKCLFFIYPIISVRYFSLTVLSECNNDTSNFMLCVLNES